MGLTGTERGYYCVALVSDVIVALADSCRCFRGCNGVEGGLSIGFGAESRSRSLIFFGIQSTIEVIFALLVVWRFFKVAQSGEERASSLGERYLE